MTDPVILVTADEIIEGIVHYPAGIRLSDAFNAMPYQDAQFVILTRATVRSRTTGIELLRSDLLMTARHAIRMVVPVQDLTMLNVPNTEGVATVGSPNVRSPSVMR
jgi:hypothetical protein